MYRGLLNLLPPLAAGARLAPKGREPVEGDYGEDFAEPFGSELKTNLLSQDPSPNHWLKFEVKTRVLGFESRLRG